jgi:predicted membrane-bound spermidine synthase
MIPTTLSVIFFLSGVSALLFENLWFYQAGITFGNSVWASSLVLAGFMGGLALGSALAARLRPGGFRPIRVYALLEIAIGIFGLALVVGLPSLTSLLATVFAPLLTSPALANPLRLGCAFLLLLVPSTAMGATLPVMVSALYRRDPRFGSVLGRLYGWNTLGAVVGALAGEAFLVEAIGVRGTGFVAAGISVSVATVAFALSRHSERDAAQAEPMATPTPVSARARWLLAAAAVAGFALLGLEVVWFRFLLHFLFGSSATFAILLAAVLAGIGVGGFVGAFIASPNGRAQRLLPGTAALTGAICVALYVLYPSGPNVNTWAETATRALLLMFPVALLSGVLFTLLGEAVKNEEECETRAAGLLTLSNTIGAMAGPLLVGFVLLPTLGVDRSLQLLAGLYALIGGLTVLGGARPKHWGEIAFTYAAGASLLVAVLFFPAGETLKRHLRPVVDSHSKGGAAQPVAMREGLTETIIYMEEQAFGAPVSYRMLTNGYSMSSTNVNSLRYMKLFVYLPMALNPDAKTALLISYGVGSTAKALTDTAGLESIDMVDISRDVLEMNDIVYPQKGTLPLDDPRVHAHIEDGRYFLETTKNRFDLITGEPPPPKMAGVVNLYTREYFFLIRERLNEGGIVSYWLPAHQLTLHDSKSIIGAFCDAFDDCTLWGGAGLDWILLGTRGATGPVTRERFARQWVDPAVGPELIALGLERPEQLGALFMAGADSLKEIASDTAPLTDDRPKRLSAQPFDVQADFQTYVPWMDTTITRTRFERSPWIEQVWPSELRASALPYFSVQHEINHVLVSGPRQMQEVLPTIHSLLTRTELETLPLWMLASNVPRQVAASRALAKGRGKAEVYWELGLGALVQRDYRGAHEHFVRAAQQGAHGPRVLSLLIYTQFMASDRAGMDQLLADLKSGRTSESAEPWLIQLLHQVSAAR